MLCKPAKTAPCAAEILSREFSPRSLRKQGCGHALVAGPCSPYTVRGGYKVALNTETGHAGLLHRGHVGSGNGTLWGKGPPPALPRCCQSL